MLHWCDWIDMSPVGCELGIQVRHADLAWDALDRLPSPIPAYEHLVIDGLATGDLPLCTAAGFAR